MLRSSRNLSVHFPSVLPCYPIKRWARIAILVLNSVLLSSPSPAQGQDAQSGHQASIHGTVINSFTHEPISRAQVYTQDDRFAVMTDDQGHFEVAASQNEIAGKFSSAALVARKPGFLMNLSGPNIRLSSDVTEITISLVPEAILMGRITLDSSDSPDGIRVQLFRKEISEGLARWAPRDIATTNSRGEFRFAELYAGDYRIGTHEAGDRDPADIIPGGKMYEYPPVYFPEASYFPSASTVHLSPGRVFQADLSLARRQYYPVKISVISGLAAGTPINVSISVRGDGAPGYSLGYNAFDHTIRGSLPNGYYVVEASSFTQAGATGVMNLRVANGPAQSAQLTMLPNGTIPVQVREEFTSTVAPQPDNGVIISGGIREKMFVRSRHQYLNVMLEPVSDFGQGRGGSLHPPAGQNDESLGIDNVQQGRYWVRVTTSRGYAASVTSGGLDLQHQPFVVGPGGSSSPIEITMRDGTASFNGSIEAAKGEIEGSNSLPGQSASPVSSAPFAYLYCVPQPDSTGQYTQVWVSPEGKFESPPIPPGEYRVLAFRHQQNDLEYRNAEAMRAYESKGQVVRLVAGQKEHLQLQLVSKADENAN